MADTDLEAIERLAAARKRLRAGKPADRLLARAQAHAARSAAEVQRRTAIRLRLDTPPELPVGERRSEIIAAMRTHRVLVITGETGSGKTTQLPKMLLAAGRGRRGMIAVTQPRRVAAVSVARRLVEETAAPGAAVAHAIRFDDRSGADTLVRICTDGLLLAEAGRDPDLLRYDCVVVDEAHERSLNIDVLLGLLRRLLVRRSDLMVVVTSASIDAERFAGYFARDGEPAPVIALSGRVHPVDVIHRDPGDSDVGFLHEAVRTVRELHAEEPAGDILCFLPTERDILEARRRLADVPGMSVLPLYGRLNPREQQRVFAPARGRKVVLATNIAETSITVPGIRYVVDAGLARIKRYSAASRTERLPIEPVSQASLLQRAGRAGRVMPGICIRLCGEEDVGARPAYTEPEIRRSNVAGVLLHCLAAGLGDPEDFPWMDPPAAGAWTQARALLRELGAIAPTSAAARHRLTSLGRRLARIPADPQIARVLLSGVEAGCPHEVCTLAAFLSVIDPRLRPPGEEAAADAAQAVFLHEAGDLATALNLWRAFAECPSGNARARFAKAHFLGYRRLREWADVRHQLWRCLREDLRLPGLPPAAADEPDLDAIHRAVLTGMLGNVCMNDPEARCYRAAGNRQVQLHPGSALRKTADGAQRTARPAWLLACEIVETSRVFVRLCAPIDPRWILDLAPDGLKRSYRDPHFDPASGRVVCREDVSWKGLPLVDGRRVGYQRIDPEAACAIFVTEALAAERIEQRFAFCSHNRRVLARLRSLEHRLRDPTLAVDRGRLEAHHRAALSSATRPVASVAALRAFIKQHGDAGLRLDPAAWVGAGLWQRVERDFPSRITMGGKDWLLRYRFAPGESDDGATLEIREADLPYLDAAVLALPVPGWAAEAVEACLRLLPKAVRRELIPLADTAAGLAPAVCASGLPLSQAVATAVAERLDCRVPPPDPAGLPEHLRLRIVVHNAGDEILYSGRDWRHVLALAGGSEALDPLAPLRERHQTDPGDTWPGPVPQTVAIGGLQAWCGLARARSAAATVAAQRSVYASEAACRVWHPDGVRALLEARLEPELEAVVNGGDSRLDARIERDCGTSAGALRRQLAIQVLVDASPLAARCRDHEAFAALETAARQALAAAAPEIDALLGRCADTARTIRQRLRRGSRGLGAAAVLSAVGTELSRLLEPGWPGWLGYRAALRMPHYLQALEWLLDDADLAAERAVRAQRHRARLVAAWTEVAQHADPRRVRACGLQDTARHARAVLEECLLMATRPREAPRLGAPQFGATEGLLHKLLDTLDRQLAASERADRECRQALLDAAAQLQRAPAGPIRTALERSLTDALRRLPELGQGCDLEDQHARARALIARVRSALS
ncbi:MAG: ATP-dependent RNA helicase HrpA [Planctomycetota bacterium]